MCAGSTLSELLHSRSLSWDPDLVQQLLTAVVTECHDRQVASHVLLPAVKEAAQHSWDRRQKSYEPGALSEPDSLTGPQDQPTASSELIIAGSSSGSRSGSSGRGKAMRGKTDKPAPDAPRQYQLHWSCAITANILQELTSSSPSVQSTEAAGADSDAGGGTAAGTTATLHDFLPADVSKSLGILPNGNPQRRWQSRGPGQQQQRHAKLSQLRAKVINDEEQKQQASEEKQTYPSAGVATAAAAAVPPSGDTALANSSSTSSSTNNSGSTVPTRSSSQQPADGSLSADTQLSLPCTISFTSVSGNPLPQPLPQAGDLVLLSEQPSGLRQAQDAGATLSIEGRVAESSENELQVEVPWQPVHVNKKLWKMEALGNLTTYDRMMSGLCQMTKQQLRQGVDSISRGHGGWGDGGSFMLQKVIVDSWALQVQESSNQQLEGDQRHTQQHEAGGMGEDPEVVMQQLQAAATEEVVGQDEKLLQETCGQHLDSSQLGVVRMAASQRLSFVWGPPGTGKVGGGAHPMLASVQLVAWHILWHGACI